MLKSVKYSFNYSYKDEGILFPSSKMQGELIRTFYADLKLDPRTVSYVEAHGTGKFIQSNNLNLTFEQISCIDYLLKAPEQVIPRNVRRSIECFAPIVKSLCSSVQ